jgi:hypothetical protein
MLITPHAAWSTAKIMIGDVIYVSRDTRAFWQAIYLGPVFEEAVSAYAAQQPLTKVHQSSPIFCDIKSCRGNFDNLLYRCIRFPQAKLLDVRAL